MRKLTSILIVLAGCYSPELAPCVVHCTATSPCPAELSCGTDHFCHGAGQSELCPAPLSITIDGTGDGRVLSDPVGVDCTSSSSGAGCDDIPFPNGITIILTESPTTGNTFAGWSGDACVALTTKTCTFALEGAMTINARFN